MLEMMGQVFADDDSWRSWWWWCKYGEDDIVVPVGGYDG